MYEIRIEPARNLVEVKLGGLMSNKAHALAIVTGSSLARMQVRRLFTQSYARIVATMAEGRAWVLHGIEAAAA